MKINPYFELVNIDDDYMLVPVGEMIEQFNGTVVLNEISAFILKKLKDNADKRELIDSLTKEYVVDEKTAEADLEAALQKMCNLGIIID